VTEPYELPKRPRTDVWIDRVKAADARAERCFEVIFEPKEGDKLEVLVAASLVAIAAELRAARIARRPGAGH